MKIRRRKKHKRTVAVVCVMQFCDPHIYLYINIYTRIFLVAIEAKKKEKE